MDDIFISTPYGQIFGKVAGSLNNPLILGLHGWSQKNGWHTWEPLLEPLAEAGFYVVSVDMPGWGQSIPLKPVSMAGDTPVAVVLSILDGLGAKTAVLMGKSWGGGVALSLALTQPQRVDKLILTAPAFRERGKLGSVAHPVLLAWAKDDPVIPVENARPFANALPHCELQIYLIGGHSAAPNNVQAFAPIAIKFLQN